MTKVLLIEDDLPFATFLCSFLEKKEYKVTHAPSLLKTKKFLTEQSFDVVLSDMRLPDAQDLEVIPLIRKYSKAPIIMMSNYAEVSLAVSSIKQGAVDYLQKPIEGTKLLQLLKDTTSKDALPLLSNSKNSSNNISKSLEKKVIKGSSLKSKSLYQTLDLVAPTSMSILIIGESGTGKEHIAKQIHKQSRRANEVFIAVDCGAIPKEIATSEFFGHLKGSFTGALENKKGFFESAHKGTLFLDEIGNLSYELQVQLLRAVQERKIRKIGSQQEVEIDIRIISATNSNLREATTNGSFREDLWHRINEFTLTLPPLRQRLEDLTLFIDYFIDKANDQLSKKCSGISIEALQSAKEYHWVGNLRELQNVIKRAVLMTEDNGTISKITFEAFLNRNPQKQEHSNQPYDKKLHEIERIENAIYQCAGNKAKAARLLEIDRKTLYNKIKRYGLNL